MQRRPAARCRLLDRLHRNGDLSFASAWLRGATLGFDRQGRFLKGARAPCSRFQKLEGVRRSRRADCETTSLRRRSMRWQSPAEQPSLFTVTRDAFLSKVLL